MGDPEDVSTAPDPDSDVAETAPLSTAQEKSARMKARKMALLKARGLPAAPQLASSGVVDLGGPACPQEDWLATLTKAHKKGRPIQAPTEVGVIRTVKNAAGEEELRREVLKVTQKSPSKGAPAARRGWLEYKRQLDSRLKAKARRHQLEREQRYREEKMASGEVDEEAVPKRRGDDESSTDEDFDPHAPDVDEDDDDAEDSEGSEKEEGSEDEEKEDPPAKLETDFSGLRGAAQGEEGEEERESSPDVDEEEPFTLHLSPSQSQSQMPTLFQLPESPQKAEEVAPSQPPARPSDELLDLCSGAFPDSQAPEGAGIGSQRPLSALSDGTVDIRLLASAVGPPAPATQDLIEEDSDVEEADAHKTKKRRVLDSDESGEEGDEEEDDGEEGEEGDDEGAEEDGGEVSEGEEDEELAMVRRLQEAEAAGTGLRLHDKKGRLRSEFVEGEAELSGESSGDELDGEDLDFLEPEAGDFDPTLPSEERLRAQLAKMANKQDLAEDEALMGALKDALLDDQDAGAARKRRFRWAVGDEGEGAELEAKVASEAEDEDEENWSPGKIAYIQWRASKEEEGQTVDLPLPANDSFSGLGQITIRKPSAELSAPHNPEARPRGGCLDFSSLLGESLGRPAVARRDSLLGRLDSAALAHVAKSSAMGSRVAEHEAGSAKSLFNAPPPPKKTRTSKEVRRVPELDNSNSLFDSLQ